MHGQAKYAMLPISSNRSKTASQLQTRQRDTPRALNTAGPIEAGIFAPSSRLQCMRGRSLNTAGPIEAGIFVPLGEDFA